MRMSVQDEKVDQAVIDNRAGNVAELFLQRVEKTPDAAAYQYPVGDKWETLTWSQASQRVHNIAAGLLSLGVQGGDRVALASATCLEWVLADLGVMLTGAATTTIYPTTTQDDTVYILSDSGSVVLLAENPDQAAKVTTKRDAVPALQHIVVFEGAAEGDDVITLAELEERGAAYLAEHPDDLKQRVAALTPQSLSTLIYTSGTTGRPKGVRLPHDAWTYEVAAVDAIHILGPDDLQYLWLPLSHVFGKVLLTLPLQIGFPTAVDGRVDKIIENLPIVKPTWMGAAPRIFEKVYGRISTMMADEGGAKAKLFLWASDLGRQASDLKSEGKTPSGAFKAKLALADKLVLSKVRGRFGGRIRFFISGSAALNRDVARWFDGMGLTILEGYGMTETSAASAVNRPYLGANQIGTVGWPLPGTQFRVASDGELLIKGPGVTQGYWNLDDVTAEALEDGWLHTGDIGEITPEGHVKITDRKKDLFKTSNGKYVAPSIIESTFMGLCPYASQLVIEGEGRKFVSALITLDEEGITDWAKEKPAIAGKDYRTIVTSDEAREMVQGYVDELNGGLNRWEQVKRFIILPRDLSVDDGEVTPSLKVKRKVVTTKFKQDLDALYD